MGLHRQSCSSVRLSSALELRCDSPVHLRSAGLLWPNKEELHRGGTRSVTTMAEQKIIKMSFIQILQ